MTVIYSSGYTLPGSDYPLTHARIAHANNWLAGGDATASSTATGYFEDAPLTSLTYEKWKPTGSTGSWEYDHGSSAAVDYCVVGAHTLGTSGSTLTVEYWDGTAWQNAAPATAISTDEPIMVIFPPQTRQVWRVSFTGSAAPEIGVVKFGTAMQFPRPIFGGFMPFIYGRETVMRSTNSESGEFLGRTRQRTYLTTSLSWNNLPDDWVRANWKDFQLAIEEEPFFLAWRPGTYGDVALCYVSSLPMPSFSGTRNLMEVSMDITARSYD